MQIELWLAIILIVAAVAVGLAIGFIMRKVIAEKKLGSAEEQARKILEDAIKGAESAKKESIISAKEEIFQLKKETDIDLKERRKEVSKQVGFDVDVKSYIRYETGEGIEKKEEDFAAEVAKQMGQ